MKPAAPRLTQQRYLLLQYFWLFPGSDAASAVRAQVLGCCARGVYRTIVGLREAGWLVLERVPQPVAPYWSECLAVTDAGRAAMTSLKLQAWRAGDPLPPNRPGLDMLLMDAV